MADSGGSYRRKQETYKLTIKEYDGKEAFYTGKMPYKSSVDCTLTESNLDVTIEKVVGSYLPIKYVMGSDGMKNLTTDRRKRVTLFTPVRALFGPETKNATLYIHFGSVFDKGFHQKNEQYFREAMQKLKESFDAPGFWNSSAGDKGKFRWELGQELIIVRRKMQQLDNELKKPHPNMGIVQRKLWSVNKFIGTTVVKKRKELAKVNRMKMALMMIIITLPICIILAFFCFAI